MIEPAMFFLAGLLVAGLAGLLILPAFSRRALRLSSAKARLLAPLSIKDVVAERDLLRAEHAIALHRMERKLIRLEEMTARRRAELGRQAAEIVALEDDRAKLSGEIVDLSQALAAGQGEIRTLEANLGASRVALNDFGARLDRAASEIAALTEARVALETLADGHRATIAGLETRAAGLELGLEDAQRLARSAAAAAEAEQKRAALALHAEIEEVGRLDAELLAATASNARTVAALEKTAGELERTRSRLAEVEAALAARDRSPADAGDPVAAKTERAGWARELREAAGAVARMNAELGAALTGKDRIAAALDRTTGELERTRRRLADAEATLAARERSLADAREAAGREDGATSAGDRALRAAIAQLAADVVRLGAAAAEPPHAAERIDASDAPAPPSQGPPQGDGAAPAPLRQLQSTALER